MKWFFPSWNGDFRLEPIDNEYTELIIQDPTAHETQLLQSFLQKCRRRKKWLATRDAIKPDLGPYRTDSTRKIVLRAPLSKVAPVLIDAMKIKDRTLTALSFAGGRLKIAHALDDEATEKLAKDAEKPEAKAAVTVSRPTPCCPQCQEGSIEPATEVLLSFLNRREHEDWARRRCIIVRGGRSGHRYLLAHRHGAVARRIGRICYDLDDRAVMHFYDWSIPPEEEVLATKLILQHREPWLRNEATALGFHTDVYKNPFGGLMDGTESASLLSEVGAGILGAVGGAAFG